MKKMMLTLALVLTAALSSNAQLLYKISGNGLEKPSYIIGTYHLAPVSFTDSIPGLKEALNAAEQEYGELDMSDMMSAENTQKMQAAMMLPEGQTLDKLLTEEQMTRLNGMMKTLMGMDMTNPMVAQQLGKMTPKALTVQMSLLMWLKKNPNFNPQETFDGYFQEVMAGAGKPVKGFETVDFQVNALLKGTPMERQIEILMCMVDNQEWQEMMVDKIVSAFFSQDMKTIEVAFDEKLNNSCDDTPEERDRLIYSRNANWLKAMPQIMKEKSTVFAVGAVVVFVFLHAEGHGHVDHLRRQLQIIPDGQERFELLRGQGTAQPAADLPLKQGKAAVLGGESGHGLPGIGRGGGFIVPRALGGYFHEAQLLEQRFRPAQSLGLHMQRLLGVEQPGISGGFYIQVDQSGVSVPGGQKLCSLLRRQRDIVQWFH